MLKRIGMSSRHEDLDVSIGDTVKIVDGAFTGLDGKVNEVDNEKQRLKVNIEMFGRETSTDLDFNQIDTNL